LDHSLLSTGDTAEVFGTDGEGLNVRSNPSADASIVQTLEEGSSLSIASNPTADVDGSLWYQVEADGASGWANGVFLAQVDNLEQQVAAGQTAYFIDCVSGQDGNSGTSASNAWSSLERANAASLGPGDALFLRRGCVWNGPLFASWHGTADQPIVIAAYGRGNRPMIADAPNKNVIISGSNQVLAYLQTSHSDATYDFLASNCLDQPVGWKVGFSFEDSAHDNTLRNVKTFGHAVGVNFTNGSHHNRLLFSQVHDNDGLWRLEPADPLGGLGVNLHGNANEVGWNTFRRNESDCTLDDSGVASDRRASQSLEVFNATNSSVHHNRSTDRIFAELGSGTLESANNTFAYNIQQTADTRSRFIVTRGTGAPFGPVWNTAVYNNVVYNTGDDSQGVTCGACSTDVLTLTNNIIVTGTKGLYIDEGNTVNESHNLFWSVSGLLLPNNFLQNVTLSRSSFVANPGFVDPENGDFHLSDDSIAIDRGLTLDWWMGNGQDLDGDAAPMGPGVDIGADEVR